MPVKAYGKRFSWEETIFHQANRIEDTWVRVLGHELSGGRYRNPTTSAEKEFSACPGVYLLHAPDGEIVYVGQAKRLAARLIAHSGDHLRGRWSHYSWFATDIGVDPEEAEKISTAECEDSNNDDFNQFSLNTLEAVLRTAIEPRLNLQGGRWGDVPMYAQSVEYEFMYTREVYQEVRKNRKRLKKILKRTPI